MIEGKMIAYKIGSKWYLGKANKCSVKQISEVKKLSDVPEARDYIPLLSYLKDNGIDKDRAIAFQHIFLKKAKIDNVYVKRKRLPIGEEVSAKEYENIWWDNLNDVCLSCTNMCKQSKHVDLYFCTNYIGKEVDDNK